MNRTMITATNTMTGLQKQLDTIANNIANIDQNGFKRREVSFTELVYQQIDNQRNPNREIGRLTPNGIRQGTGAKAAGAQFVMTQGAIKQTDRDLDAALTKEGQLYKVLVQSDGGSEIQYTRNGAFYLSPLGENEVALVNEDGHLILDENNNPIYIVGDAERYDINEAGELTVTMTDGTLQSFAIGVIQVHKPQFLESKGNNLYGVPVDFPGLGVAEEEIFTELSGELRNEIGVQQGALEQSNVDLSKEMTDLLNVQRAYQFQSRAISLADQMMGLINGIR